MTGEARTTRSSREPSRVEPGVGLVVVPRPEVTAADRLDNGDRDLLWLGKHGRYSAHLEALLNEPHHLWIT